MIQYSIKRGFTLIELSIVLVILGLLVGGVLIGKDLIKVAEYRTVIAQRQEFDAALNAFKGKYGNYLPGDMPAATARKFGFFDFNIGSNGSAGGYGMGDNDGFLVMGEDFIFWRQLSEARLIKGNYGMDASNPLDPSTGVPTINPSDRLDPFLPKLKMGGAYFHAMAWDFFYEDGDSCIECFNAFGIVTTLDGWGQAFTPQEAFYFDSKMDDSKPNTGKIISDPSWNLTPLTGVCNYSGTSAFDRKALYNINSSAGGDTKACFLYIGIQYFIKIIRLY